jgi:hypothetical protein
MAMKCCKTDDLESGKRWNSSKVYRRMLRLMECTEGKVWGQWEWSFQTYPWEGDDDGTVPGREAVRIRLLGGFQGAVGSWVIEEPKATAQGC